MHYKTITIFDLMRSLNYAIMLGLGLSNKYRYDHLISKLDFFYDFDKIRIAMNLAGRDRQKNTDNYSKFYTFVNELLLSLLKK